MFCDALGGFRDPNNVRRDLRRARAPYGRQARRDLGEALAAIRRSAKQSRRAVAEARGWPKTRLELVEAGRVRLEVDDVVALLDLYRARGSQRARLLTLAEEAAQPSEADALSAAPFRRLVEAPRDVVNVAGQGAVDGQWLKGI